MISPKAQVSEDISMQGMCAALYSLKQHFRVSKTMTICCRSRGVKEISRQVVSKPYENLNEKTDLPSHLHKRMDNFEYNFKGFQTTISNQEPPEERIGYRAFSKSSKKTLIWAELNIVATNLRPYSLASYLQCSYIQSVAN